MKNIKILLLVLSLETSCFSETLMLPDDVDKIVVEVVFRPPKKVDTLKLILDKKMNKPFMRELNNSKLNTQHDEEILLYKTYFLEYCYEVNIIKIYNKKTLLAEFYTIGTRHYDEKNDLFYYSRDNLLRKEYWGKNKYWPWLLEENACKR